MANYEEERVKLTNTQLKQWKFSAKKKIIRLDQHSE